MYTILPPHLADRLAQHRPRFAKMLRHDAGLRHGRLVLGDTSDPGGIEVYDAEGGWSTPPEKKADPDLDQAERIRAWADVTRQVMTKADVPDGIVRYGDDYANAFFDGRYLVFGMGDGEVFRDFTFSLDVFAHELGHQVIDSGPRLEYAGQPGALNEHVADVIGVAVRNAHLGGRSWRIGDTLFLDGVSALRDMASPGTAYSSELLGDDPQVGHMRDYVVTYRDNGGVHINSGIPNKAFVAFCQASGEPAHQAPLMIWMRALAASGPQTDFSLFAGACVTAAGTEYRSAVQAAWSSVGVVPARGIAA